MFVVKPIIFDEYNTYALQAQRTNPSEILE